MRTLQYTKIYRDPVYGYIPVYNHELQIIQTKLFQRLRRIRQLHSACLPYYCGEHSRYSHSIGVMHLAGIFAESLLRPYFFETNGDGSSGDKKTLFNKYFFLTRLWGLIHDIGHGPFSHAYEYYVLERHGLNHETLGEKIVKERLKRVTQKEENDEFGKAIYHYVQTFNINEELILDVFRKKPAVATDGPEYALHQYLFKGYYNVDVIDYIPRDAYFCGVPEYGKIDWDRIVKTIRLVRDPEDQKLKVVIEERATHTITSLLVSRIHMYSAVYYHKDARSSEQLFRTLMELADDLRLFENYLPDAPSWDRNLENLDDYAFISQFLTSKTVRDDWHESKKIAFDSAKEAAESIMNGRLASEAIFEFRVHEREPLDKIPTAVQSDSQLKRSEDYIKSQVKELIKTLSEKEEIKEEAGSTLLSSTKEWFVDSSSFDMSRLRPVRSGQHPFPGDIPVYHRRTKEIVPISKFEPLLRYMPFSYYILRLHVPTEVDQKIERGSELFKKIERIFEDGIFLRC